MTSLHGRYAIIGLGQTGVSCAKYLALKNESFFIMDTRPNPPGLNEISRQFPDIPVITGKLDPEPLKQVEYILPSPGVPLSLPAIRQALSAGVKLISDIDLFCQHIEAPIVCITGSNGKSTVTALLGEMAKKAGVNATVAGNIGIPVLDLLAERQRELYILELSSFQLERTHCLRPNVAVLLNISPDHLDVHGTFEAYKAAKHRIFEHCARAVCNQEDHHTWPAHPEVTRQFQFTSNVPAEGQFGLVKTPVGNALALGKRILLTEHDIKIKGVHNLSNIAAALTAGRLLDFPLSCMLEAAKDFPGLSHRCQWVAKRKGADWFNDSKGTNEAASIAAITGLACNRYKGILLIAGGDGKGSDFSELADAICHHASSVILIGKDAEKIAMAVGNHTPLYRASSLEMAVKLAASLVKPGERVLLSPACTSLDMFADYQERGNVFVQEVMALEQT